MSPRPEGESRKDRRRQFYVGIAAIIALFSLIGNVAQTTIYHHTSTQLQHTIIAKDDEIVPLLHQHSTALNNEVALEQQVAKVIDGLSAADATLAEFAVWIEGCLSKGNCSSPPQL
jgi:hypothetical protein